jgi:Acetyltransferase (GNAT) family
MIYTKLTREDALDMLVLAEQMHKEAVNYKGSPFNAQLVWESFDATVLHPTRYSCVYAKNPEGKIIGAIMGKINEQFFSGDLVASDCGMFILPEYRGSITFVKLFKAFEAWAIENEARSIIVAHTTGINTEKSKDLFPRLGYSLMGYVFNKEIR